MKLFTSSTSVGTNVAPSSTIALNRSTYVVPIASPRRRMPRRMSRLTSGSSASAKNRAISIQVSTWRASATTWSSAKTARMIPSTERTVRARSRTIRSCGSIGGSLTAPPDDPSLASRDVTAGTLHTNKGAIEFELFDDDAPKTVENFLKLARDGFYDGVIFHRVIPDFMIQGGDPTGTGSGGPGYEFEDEFNQHKVVRGALAMANAGPNTNGSQFFIVTADATPWLDGKHTVFGQVTGGMDVVDRIGNTQTDSRDRPVDAIGIETLSIDG